MEDTAPLSGFIKNATLPLCSAEDFTPAPCTIEEVVTPPPAGFADDAAVVLVRPGFADDIVVLSPDSGADR